jgi:hypothetical protein
MCKVSSFIPVLELTRSKYMVLIYFIRPMIEVSYLFTKTHNVIFQLNAAVSENFYSSSSGSVHQLTEGNVSYTVH